MRVRTFLKFDFSDFEWFRHFFTMKFLQFLAAVANARVLTFTEYAVEVESTAPSMILQGT